MHKDKIAWENDGVLLVLNGIRRVKSKRDVRFEGSHITSGNLLPSVFIMGFFFHRYPFYSFVSRLT